MAITVASIITNFDTYIGDSSNDRISAAERLQLITEGTVWLQEELGNDHMVRTYTLPYFDNVHYYKITSAVASLLESADLRRAEEDQGIPFAHKSAQELATEIGLQETESSWAVERRDGDWYLAVNHNAKYSPVLISACESLTADGGTWEVDSANSDATNLTVDSVEFKQGNGSFNFDVDVSQSGNDRATIVNDDFADRDLSSYEDLASWVFWIYVPDVTEFTGVTLYWGSSSSSYWSASATSDMNSNAWVDGWNRVKINWSDATATSSPDETAISYLRIDFNYSGSQGDDTDFRFDDLTLVRPENLTFHYTSWYVGDTSTADTTKLTAFAATTNVPFFSGQYDQYKYAVAHKAASLAYYGPLRLADEGAKHEVEAIKALNRAKKMIPSSVTKEVKSFKVSQLNFRRGARRTRR